MKAIASFPGNPSPMLVEVPEPDPPAAGEVLCRSLQVGVCGTDREILKSQDPFLADGQQYLVLGHECLARVEQVGEGVSDIQIGDLVTPEVRRALPGYRRRPDLLAWGQYIERGIVEADGFTPSLWIDRPEYLVQVEPEIESVAVLVEPISITEKAANEALLLQQARLGPREWVETPPRVLVTGMGPIAFAGIISCVSRDWPVTVWGRDPEDSFRAQLVQHLGACYWPKSQHDLVLADVEQDGFDLILECTGNDEVMVRSARSLASCGVIVWLGSSRMAEPRSHNVTLMMREGLLRNHIHLGAVNAARRDFVHALEHLKSMSAKSPDALASIITCQTSVADSLWHYDNREPQGIKTVLMYD